MYPPKWLLRAIVTTGAVVAIGTAPRAGAQPPQPGPAAAPAPAGGQPQLPPPGVLLPGQPRLPVLTPPALPNVPGIAFNPDPFFTNPFLNPTQFVPVNTLAPNPFFANPYLVNPFTGRMMNPANPFAIGAADKQPLAPPTGPFDPNPFTSPFAPAVFSTPAVAIQQPGYLQWRGPDLLVNPWSGTAVKPFSGVAQTADGRVYFQLGRDGTPTVFNPSAPRTGIYVDPTFGSYLNPTTGVIVRPGGTTVFLPWTP